jgi:superfamily II DNA or RNA helicase
LLVRLQPLGREALQVDVLVENHPDAPRYHPGLGPAEILALTGERKDAVQVLARDLDEERSWATAAMGLPEGADVPVAWVIDDRDEALDLVHRLQRSLQVEMEWPREARWRVGEPTGPLRLQLDEDGGFFDVSGALPAGEAEVRLALLLEAIRENRRYVQVDGDQWLALDEVLSRRLRALELVAQPVRGGGVRLPPQHAAVADRLWPEADLSGGEAFEALLRRAREARRTEPETPASLRADLRPYQREGYRWLARLSQWGGGACLADDMGLGKTVQVLALLCSRVDSGPALVVAPTSVGFNWIREAERFAPALRRVHYQGADRRLGELGPGDVVVTSYALLARDGEALAARTWGTLVFDEAQAIKNARTLRAKVARSVEADFKIALTGTPVENHLGELWSIFDAVSPGLLGSAGTFRERFVLPIEGGTDPRRGEALAELVRPFLLRRTKAQVAPELPPREESVVDVLLAEPERRRYEELRLATVTALRRRDPNLTPQQRRVQVLGALGRLRQLCCHPGLDEPSPEPRSSKLDTLLELLLELHAEGRRALVFSQFTRLLRVAERVVGDAGLTSLYLDGRIPSGRRGELVGEATVFLISLKAGGTGLNLTAADTVIHLDPWWNPAVEAQATDRTHRIGQTQAVTVYRLIARETVEEAVVEMHARKKALADGVLDGADQAAALSADELIGLIERSWVESTA